MDATNQGSTRSSRPYLARAAKANKNYKYSDLRKKMRREDNIGEGPTSSEKFLKLEKLPTNAKNLKASKTKVKEAKTNPRPFVEVKELIVASLEPEGNQVSSNVTIESVNEYANDTPFEKTLLSPKILSHNILRTQSSLYTLKKQHEEKEEAARLLKVKEEMQRQQEAEEQKCECRKAEILADKEEDDRIDNSPASSAWSLRELFCWVTCKSQN